MLDPRLSLAGLVVGICVGLSGVGGSAILAPMLILVLGVKPSIVVGTDLLYSVPTKLFAMALHQRAGTIDWRVTRLLLTGGIPGAIAGIGLFSWLRGHADVVDVENWLRHGIGVAILVAGAMTLMTIFRRRVSVEPNGDVQPGRSVAVVAIGALVGLLVSLTSIGSGSITLPLLTIALPALATRRLIGAEIAFAAFLIPVAAIGQGALGNVDWPMACSLFIGSIPGVWIGAKLCTRLGDAWLRPTIVAVLVFAGSRLL